MAWLTALLTLPFRGLAELTRRFLGLSLPARIAWSVGVIQLLLCLFTLLLVVMSGGRMAFQSWWTPGKGLLLLLLLLLVPLFVFLALRLWLHQEVSRWRDIEQAWKEAVAELKRQQVDVRNAPLFLVLGTDGRDDEQSLMQMAPTPFVVVSAPPGSAPLHVYAGHEAIFVCLSAIGQCCTLAASWRRPEAKPSATGAEPATEPRTMGLTAAQRAEAFDRLTAFCERIVALRQPVAPINGIAVVAKLGLEAELTDPGTFGSAVAEDLLQLTRMLGLRAPVTFAFTSSTAVRGFKEAREVLPAGDRARAIGQPLPLGLPIASSDVEAAAISANGKLTDLLGGLLVEDKAVERPAANRSIVGLSCLLRTTGVDAITRIVQRSIDMVTEDAGPLLAGCYFVLLSPHGEGGFFGRGFFERVLATQGDLDWTAARLRLERRYRVLSFLFTGLIILAVAAIVATVAWRVTRG